VWLWIERGIWDLDLGCGGEEAGWRGRWVGNIS
jgi:hypothetical protein